MLPPQLQGLPVPITCDAGPAQFGSHSHKDPGRDPSAFEAESLRCHNVYRARHGARALTWSRMLSNSAKRWAEVLRRMRCIHHSCRNIKRVTIGENIAVVHTNVPHLCTGDEVTRQWYSEVEQYDYQRGADTSICGHFTQMVWCSSQQFGIGQATTSDGHSLIVVAHYYPAGNIEGQYSINVLPPSRPALTLQKPVDAIRATTTTTGTTTTTTGTTTTTTGNTTTTTGTTTTTTNIGTTTGNTTTTTGTTTTTTGNTTTTTGTTTTTTNIGTTTGNTTTTTGTTTTTTGNTTTTTGSTKTITGITTTTTGTTTTTTNIGTTTTTTGNTTITTGNTTTTTGNTTTTTTTTGTTTITTGNTTTTTGTTATTTGTTTTTTGNTTTTTGTTATTTGTTTTTTGTTKTITGITTNTITNTNDSTTSTTTTSTILPEQSNKHLRNLPQMKEAGTLLNPDQTPSKACQPAPTPHSPSVTHPQPLAVFIKDCVETHNKYRLRHKSPPLLLLETLGKLAQEWADSVAQESHMGHSNYQYMGQHIGQNILFRWKRQGVSLTGSEVCDIWYSQIKNFDFSQYIQRHDTGQFSQMVWKNSRFIGVGRARNSVGAVAVVVFYHPAGNITSDIRQNVLEPV